MFLGLYIHGNDTFLPNAFITDAICGGPDCCSEGKWPSKYSNYAACKPPSSKEDSSLTAQELVSQHLSAKWYRWAKTNVVSWAFFPSLKKKFRKKKNGIWILTVIYTDCLTHYMGLKIRVLSKNDSNLRFFLHCVFLIRYFQWCYTQSTKIYIDLNKGFLPLKLG